MTRVAKDGLRSDKKSWKYTKVKGVDITTKSKHDLHGMIVCTLLNTNKPSRTPDTFVICPTSKSESGGIG